MSEIDDLRSDSPYNRFEVDSVEEAVTVFKHLEKENNEKGNTEAGAVYCDAANFLHRELIDDE